MLWGRTSQLVRGPGPGGQRMSGSKLEGETHARNERKGPLNDVGQGPTRIQGLLGHQGAGGGARNTLVLAIQTGTEGRPGSASQSSKDARGPVPTHLIGRLRGEAPPRCILPEQADRPLQARPQATKAGRHGPHIELGGGA